MKQEQKYYIVTLTTGGFDEMWRNNIFITDKEYKAKFYCSKGNSILKKYKEYYSGLINAMQKDYMEQHKHKANYCHFSDRNSLAMGIFGYHELEFRDNIKIK